MRRTPADRDSGLSPIGVERPRRSSHAAFVVYLKLAAILAILTTVGIAAHSTQTPIGPMPTARSSILESSTVPAWLYAFSTVQLELAAEMRLELVEMAVVSNEHQKRAALIGMLHNRSGALSGAALTLSYVGSDGSSVMSSVSNAALVSEVPAGGLLPFRFLLLPRDALPNESLGLRISVNEGLSPSRRALRAVMRPDYSFRGRGANGVVMTGNIEISPGDSAHHSDEKALLISVVLLDNNGRLLDVIAGSRAWRLDSNMQHVEFDSFLPIGRRVRSVQAYVEAVSDIK